MEENAINNNDIQIDCCPKRKDEKCIDINLIHGIKDDINKITISIFLDKSCC